ncbi:3-deoxy-manno-octulosonate cytidylyltransferase [Belliella kenyensis]|uniref:3-deoxy-manno-octulosonate cytidylyltransferase n=1 Tax=Belliella kenyensis TaxID=1472724 RepID=A0ABV8EH39_9BACT|nr:3-deoxy-manno-octulosonate cytidylyltransferase [Belliella kenyensis]MCH7401811.1 3-deoxy-manno-octulosonate cytidylyltransferase [Belliella kenyensis]MDN3604311.1 3-deoxy-manno-octulosonate cytidylyltransferase [Belliella kenyensis]
MKKLKTTALIPARYASTRLPAKLVQDLAGKSVIQQTFLSAKNTGLFDQIIVATDHEEIAEQIKAVGGEVFRSQHSHESGSDRIAEAAQSIETDLIINIQGDEPLLDKDTLSRLIEAFRDDSVQMASVMFKIPAWEAENPNAVKVVVDENLNALYFSRHAIPFNREKEVELSYWKHVGIYAYRKELLMQFTKWPKSALEQAEMLEQLRVLEHGVKIRMVATTHQAIAIDTAEDLINARERFEKTNK